MRNVVWQILGLFDRLTMDVKVEVQSKEEWKAKLEESQRKEEIIDVALKATDFENKKLTMRNESLTESKEELQKRFAQLVEVRNFWAAEGSDQVVRTCLRSPEVYEWLLEFTGVKINIGYSTGVKAIFAAHLKDKDPKEFKDFAKGDVDTGEQIKRRVEQFKFGQMSFEFLDYLSANPGLSFGGLREMDTTVYRRLDGSYEGIVEATQATTVAAQGLTVLPQSLAETGTEVEREGLEPGQQPASSSAKAAEEDALIEESEILTGGSWDPENT